MDSIPSGGRFLKVTPKREREYNMLDTDRANDSLADTADDDDNDVDGGDDDDEDDDGDDDDAVVCVRV